MCMAAFVAARAGVAIFCGCGDFAYVVILHTNTVPLLQL